MAILRTRSAWMTAQAKGWDTSSQDATEADLLAVGLNAREKRMWTYVLWLGFWSALAPGSDFNGDIANESCSNDRTSQGMRYEFTRCRRSRSACGRVKCSWEENVDVCSLIRVLIGVAPWKGNNCDIFSNAAEASPFVSEAYLWRDGGRISVDVKSRVRRAENAHYLLLHFVNPNLDCDEANIQCVSYYVWNSLMAPDL